MLRPYMKRFGASAIWCDATSVFGFPPTWDRSEKETIEKIGEIVAKLEANEVRRANEPLD